MQKKEIIFNEYSYIIIKTYFLKRVPKTLAEYEKKYKTIKGKFKDNRFSLTLFTEKELADLIFKLS